MLAPRKSWYLLLFKEHFGNNCSADCQQCWHCSGEKTRGGYRIDILLQSLFPLTCFWTAYELIGWGRHIVAEKHLHCKHLQVMNTFDFFFLWKEGEVIHILVDSKFPSCGSCNYDWNNEDNPVMDHRLDCWLDQCNNGPSPGALLCVRTTRNFKHVKLYKCLKNVAVCFFRSNPKSCF